MDIAMTFKSYSQVGQDIWIYENQVVRRGITKGTFLDVGACHPTELSNTYALEQLGWRGILCDNDPGACTLLREQRRGIVVEIDVTKFDWEMISNLPVLIPFNYLSLDVDAASLAALENLLSHGVTFEMATCEHDRYRFGNGPRDKMRDLLRAAGYIMHRGDVKGMDGFSEFEDWWWTPEIAKQCLAAPT
jgi:hypothetical protein